MSTARDPKHRKGLVRTRVSCPLEVGEEEVVIDLGRFYLALVRRRKTITATAVVNTAQIKW